MFVLDTSVVSELRKAGTGKADPNVTTWAASVPAAGLYLSAISLLELETGALLVARRDPTQGAMLRAWLDQHVLPAFAGPWHDGRDPQRGRLPARWRANSQPLAGLSFGSS